MLASEDHGKDLASVQNLLKKHQLLEADIGAHEVRGLDNLICLYTKTGFTVVFSILGYNTIIGSQNSSVA